MPPHLVYFPIAGRGELIRLIAKVGGVELTETIAMPEGVTKAECGSGGSVPLLIDGDLKMNESIAIALYISSIAPKFADLTPQERAKDSQFCLIKEDLLSGVANIVFDDRDKDKINAVADKLIPLIEGILPKEGFINGKDFPTAADLAVVSICEGYMPFGAAFKYGKIDVAARFPKLQAHNDRTKAVAEVAAYIAESNSLGAALPGF